MFGRRYFGGRMFGPRYWGDGGSVAPPVVEEAPVYRGHRDDDYEIVQKQWDLLETRLKVQRERSIEVPQPIQTPQPVEAPKPKPATRPVVARPVAAALEAKVVIAPSEDLDDDEAAEVIAVLRAMDYL